MPPCFPPYCSVLLVRESATIVLRILSQWRDTLDPQAMVAQVYGAESSSSLYNLRMD